MKIRLSIDPGSGRPTSFEHAGPVIRIGRDPTCELSFQGGVGSAVSRQHALIELDAGGAKLTDAGSSNGTLLNGTLLERAAPLHVGDRIQMGFTGPALTVKELDLAARPARTAARVPAALMIGSAAATVVVVAGLAGVYWMHKPKTIEEYALLGPSTEAAAALHPSASDRTPPVTPPLDPVPAPPAFPPKERPKTVPNQEAKEVGAYIALEGWFSVLLRREAEDRPWAVLRPEARVSTAQTLVSLPGYRSMIALDNGVNLTLWGNLPEFSPTPPVLESVVMLHAPAEVIDLDFTLDRGRVVVANRKSSGPAQVRLRFLRQVWALELPDNKCEVAIELWGFPPERPAAAAPTPSRTCLGLFTKGRVRVKTPREDLDLGDCSRVSWQAAAPETTHRTDLKERPAWWDKAPDPNVPAVKSAMASLLAWSQLLGGSNTVSATKTSPADADSVIATIKKHLEDQDLPDPDNQVVGVCFLAALDDVESLIHSLADQRYAKLRNPSVFALQTWLSRDGRRAGELARTIERRRDAPNMNTAELIVRLLQLYPPEELDKAQTYETLVRQLDDANPLVRTLSFWQLEHLGRRGHLPKEAGDVAYDPSWGEEKRSSAIKKWKEFLANGKVPVRSPR
jgi:hypothetical protein